MTAYVNTLANAVATLIDDGSAGLPITGAVTAKRFLPIYDLADLESLQIPVAPVTESRELASRSKSSREYSVVVAPHVRAKTVAGGAIDDEYVGEFVDLMDSVTSLIETAAKAGPIGGATMTRISIDPLYDAEELRANTVLRGLITVTFRAIFSPPAA